MKQIILISVIAVFTYACSSKKTSKTSATDKPVASNNAPIMVAKPANGIYAPGNDELTAIKTTYSDVTLDQLSKGHTIYTAGACVKCHGAKNIYNRDEVRWKTIIDDMAKRAELSADDKEALTRYVFSIKAAQGK